MGALTQSAGEALITSPPLFLKRIEIRELFLCLTPAESPNPELSLSVVP